MKISVIKFYNVNLFLLLLTGQCFRTHLQQRQKGYFKEKISVSGTNIQFEDHIEMLKYAFNSISASGRLEDGLNLVRSQQRMHAFDYQFATQEGR